MKVWTQYAHMVSIFCKDLKKFILYFLPLKPRGGEDITSCVEIFREWGGFHPRGWISPPCPHCQIREGGDITPRVEIFEKGGDFTPGGDITPLSLYGLSQRVYSKNLMYVSTFVLLYILLCGNSLPACQLQRWKEIWFPHSPLLSSLPFNFNLSNL